MKIGIPLLALIACGLLAAAPGAAARGSGGGFAGSHAAFARPHAAAHSQRVFIPNRRVPNQRAVVVQRFARAPIPSRRSFIARHRIVVAPPILMTTPAFATPVFIVIRPVCCG